MTREEAIRIIKTMEINNRAVDNSVEASEEVANRFIALDMAIKALEQEPKTEQEDDYFRKIVEVAISQLRADRDRLEDELAKREQEPKVGHWIMTSDYLTTAYGSVNYVKCSCCGEDSLEEGDFCPNCGAKMVEPQGKER